MSVTGITQRITQLEVLAFASDLKSKVLGH